MTPALVGRDREIRHFLQLLRTLTPGRPAVLVLDGPPGSGRSRMLTEFAAAARSAAVTLLAEPGWTGSADTDRPVPHVVLCDHPERVDPRAWSRLEVLAGVHPLLVVLTSAAAASFLTAPEVHRLRLGPLSPAEVERLVTAAAGGRPGPELLGLTGVAAGRPGAVLDLVTGLLEEGVVRVMGGRAVLTAVRLPQRTRSRIGAQLAAMSSQARHLLQAATTLRSPFRLVRLTRLLQVSPVQLVPAIDEILASGLLAGDTEVLRFSHELVRPVVEASMPRSVLAALREEQPVRRKVAASRPPRPAPVRGTGDWSQLTDREREVARLVGRALTNRQIATRLDRSPHTVNYHLRVIYQKLAIASRVELAAMVRHQETAS